MTENILQQADPQGNHEPAEPSVEREAAALNPFDPKRLRLSQDFASAVGVKKALLTVPVRKPSKEWFVRTHPSKEYRIQTAVLELKEEHETYHVDPALLPQLADEPTISPRALFTAMSRQGALFLFPVRLPGPDGKIDDWNKSLMEAATLAATKWVRVAANMHVGAYDVSYATADWPEPTWTEEPFVKLLEVAFKDRYIDSLDHPVLQRLRGEQ